MITDFYPLYQSICISLLIENTINLNFSKAIMENLKLTYYLVDLKIKNKAPVEIYFMSRVFQVHSHCYDKRKKNVKSEIR